jgi:hypothetical protein
VYDLNTFQLEISNFALPDEIDDWPFWDWVKHLNVHASTQDPGSPSALAQLLFKRRDDLKIYSFHLISSMKGGILDELQELAGLRVYDQIKVYLDTTTREHVIVRENFGPILTKMMGAYLCFNLHASNTMDELTTFKMTRSLRSRSMPTGCSNLTDSLGLVLSSWMMVRATAPISGSGLTCDN